MNLLAGLETVLQELERLGVNAQGVIAYENTGRPGVTTADGYTYLADRETLQNEGAALEWATIVAADALGVTA